MTKLLMSVTSAVLFCLGILLTFLPEEVLSALGAAPVSGLTIIVQLLGALYFAFAFQNWMSRSSLVGGIYNRPLALANFAHFLIGGLTLGKALSASAELPAIFWGLLGVYAILGIWFGLVLFRHPAEG